MTVLDETTNLLTQLKLLVGVETPKPSESTPKSQYASADEPPLPESLLSSSEVTLDLPPADLPSLLDNAGAVDFQLWEALAYDLALGDTDDQTIALAYEILPEQLEELKQNKYFAKMMKSKLEEVKSLGTDAGFAVKFRMISNKATKEFMQRLTSTGTSNKDFHALFKTAVELGQLIPKEEEVQPQQVFGGSVVFNIQGVPGLDHLAATAQTVDNKSQDAVDAEFTDIIDNYVNAVDADSEEE